MVTTKDELINILNEIRVNLETRKYRKNKAENK